MSRARKNNQRSKRARQYGLVRSPARARKSDQELGVFIGAAGLLALAIGMWIKREEISDVIKGKLVRNRSKAEGISPTLQAALDEWDQTGPFPISIGSGIRTNEQQKTLWQMGRDLLGNVIDEAKKATNAKDTSQTAHGVRSGYGRAFDADPIPATRANYLAMGEWFEDRGFEWGGRWLSAFPPTQQNPYGGDQRHIDELDWKNIPI